MTKHSEIQIDKEAAFSTPRTRSRMSLRVKVGGTQVHHTEVTPRGVKGGTKINCYLKENHSEFSETRRLNDLVKKHSELDTRRGAASHVE